MSASIDNREFVTASQAHTRRFLTDAVDRAQVELDQDIRDRDHLQTLRDTNPDLVPDWKLDSACKKVERAFAARLLKALPAERGR